MSRTLHFKITLVGSKPPIWRKFQLTDDFRFDRFHQLIQLVMGWYNAHLHEFAIADRKIGMVLDDMWDAEPVEDETKVYLRDVPLKKGDRFNYLYDFGDSWMHELKVEKITEGEALPVCCTDGANACPPEDCGGIWGYQDLLKIRQNPNDPEHDDWMHWLPDDFDPQHFSLAEINAELDRFVDWHRKHPRAKSTPWHRI